MRPSRSLPLALAVLALSAPGEDWPQWRGPHRDGVAIGFVEPKAWPEKLTLKWKIAVGGGHSSPVVADGKIYIHTRQEDREVVTALRPENGQTIWQQSYDAPYKMNSAATSHGKGVKSTPAVADGRIFTLGISGILSCFDARTGQPQWRKEFGPFGYGVATSPLVDRGLVIVYVGGNTQGALTAFDAATGAEKWSAKGDGPAYASPIVVELAVTRQVVTQSREQHHRSLRRHRRTALADSFQDDIRAEHRDARPLPRYADLLGHRRSRDGLSSRSNTARNGPPKRSGKIKDFSMYMSSPVLTGDLLFGFSERKRGQFFCLNPADGATLWTSDGRQADSAAIVAASSVWLILTPDANLTVARQNDEGVRTVA